MQVTLVDHMPKINTNLELGKFIDRDPHWYTRTIDEVIYITRDGGYLESRNTTTVRQQIGPEREQHLYEIIYNEDQNAPMTTNQGATKATGNQSTSSSDED